MAENTKQELAASEIQKLETELKESEEICNAQIEAAKVQYKAAVKGAKDAAKIAQKSIKKDLKFWKKAAEVEL